MKLNNDNYYSPEANAAYWSASFVKSMLNCPAQALAELRGEYKRPASTALLLAAAFILFTESLVAVANELNDRLYPVLEKLNKKLPTLSRNMGNFVDYMKKFAGHVVEYTAASTIAGLSATIDTVIGWFTQDPIKKLADDVAKIAEQTSELNDKLEIAIPELEDACELLTSYQSFMDKMSGIMADNSNVSLPSQMFVNLKEVGGKLVTGFSTGITENASVASAAMTTFCGDTLTAAQTALGTTNGVASAIYATEGLHIAYHLYVRKDGKIYLGRPIDKRGGHVAGQNTHTVGICFEGNFENETMSAAQIKGGIEAVEYCKGIYPNAAVVPHKYFGGTVCPGKNFPFAAITEPNAETEPEQADNNEPNTWAVKAVEWAKANGISDCARLRDGATREEIITMLWRARNEK